MRSVKEAKTLFERQQQKPKCLNPKKSQFTFAKMKKIQHEEPRCANNKKKSFGVVFDVDGVLHKGPQRIAGAKESLQRLKDEGVPFILLTNSGGKTEEGK